MVGGDKHQVNYLRLYSDFINELDCSAYEKQMLIHDITQKLSRTYSYKQLYQIHDCISEYISKETKVEKLRVGLNAYDEPYILEILSYQEKTKLSNRAISLKYKLSRSTLVAWKRRFS